MLTRAPHVAALLAVVAWAACTPETGLIVEVHGPSAAPRRRSTPGITKLDFVVAHPSWCERWVGVAPANHTHARRHQPRSDASGRTIFSSRRRTRPTCRSRSTSPRWPTPPTAASSAKPRSTRIRCRRARCSSAQRADLSLRRQQRRRVRLRQRRRRLRLRARRAVGRQRQRRRLRHARHHQLRSPHRHRRLRADAQGRAAAGPRLRRPAVHGRADRPRPALLERATRRAPAA